MMEVYTGGVLRVYNVCMGGMLGDEDDDDDDGGSDDDGDQEKG